MDKSHKAIQDLIRCRGESWGFVKIGMLVEVSGDMGTIVGINGSANLDVVFANQLKYGTQKYNCHPTCEVKYFAADGSVLADYSKKGPTLEQKHPPKLFPSSTCVGCGCTDENACITARGGPCSWLKVNRKTGLGVCSCCLKHINHDLSQEVK